MAQRPLVVAFDVIETLFPLEPMRARLAQAGQQATVLELWFARILRDAFALTAAGDYQPFAEVATSALVSVTKGAVTDRDIDGILAGFRELGPHADAEPALRAVQDAGVRAMPWPTATGPAGRSTSTCRPAGEVGEPDVAGAVDARQLPTGWIGRVTGHAYPR
jgi:2-haloacid dehalogenase